MKEIRSIFNFNLDNLKRFDLWDIILPFGKLNYIKIKQPKKKKYLQDTYDKNGLINRKVIFK